MRVCSYAPKAMGFIVRSEIQQPEIALQRISTEVHWKTVLWMLPIFQK